MKIDFTVLTTWNLLQFINKIMNMTIWLADFRIGPLHLIFLNEKKVKQTSTHTHGERLKQLTPCKCISQPSDPTDLDRKCSLQQSKRSATMCNALCRRIVFPFYFVSDWIFFLALKTELHSLFFWFIHFLIILLNILYICVQNV